MQTIDIRTDWIKTIRLKIAEHLPGADALVYGSRVIGTAHEGSDIDIVVRNPLSPEKPFDNLIDLRDSLSESDIPVIVDILDWALIPESFKNEIMKHHKVLNAGMD